MDLYNRISRFLSAKLMNLSDRMQRASIHLELKANDIRHARLMRAMELEERDEYRGIHEDIDNDGPVADGELYL